MADDSLLTSKFIDYGSGTATISGIARVNHFVAWFCSCCVIHPSISQSKEELNNNPSSVYFHPPSGWRVCWSVQLK